jgi:hypothetical protein
MTQPELILFLNQYEDEILELVDDQDDYTRSDLQGRVMAIVRKIFAAAQGHGQQMPAT